MQSAKKRLREANVRLADMDLAWVEEGTAEFSEYLSDLNWCQAYAFQNRVEMMERILAILRDIFDLDMKTDFKVNCHHNYAIREKHFGI
jgi:tRNA-splicing ligase RtcB